jgi:hypothetical protein
MRFATAHILAVATIGLFVWLGLSSLSIPMAEFEILGVQPTVGMVFLALAALRLGLYVRQVVRIRARRRAD